jgi:hypothetical protein
VYLTLRYDRPGLENWAWTYQLDPIEGGTRVAVRTSDPGHEMWSQIGSEVSQVIDESVVKLESLLAELTSPAPV